jgi:anti-sigma factor RsiW
MRCSWCEPRLDAYLEATLRPRDARAVGAHVRSCAACATFLEELRVIDALLATARPPGVAPDFTAAVVSATHATPTRAPRRLPLGVALLLYLGIAWALAAIFALRTSQAGQVLGAASAFARSNVAAFGAAARVIAPAAPLAAAAVTGILLVDLLLLVALLYGYRRFRPLIALYLVRGERT